MHSERCVALGFYKCRRTSVYFGAADQEALLRRAETRKPCKRVGLEGGEFSGSKSAGRVAARWAVGKG